MRLSKGEVIFLVSMIVISWFVLLPMVHSQGSEHTMVEVSAEYASTLSDPTWDLYAQAEEQGITITEWNIYWKDTLEVLEEEQLLSWLQENEEFTLAEEDTLLTPHQVHLSKQVWESHRNHVTHQIQIIRYPHKSKQKTNFMYTWSGRQMASDWKEERKEIENQLSSIFQKVPQNFSCLEGFTNDKLKFDLSSDHIFKNWIANTLNGEMIQHVTDDNFISVNGYIPAWEERFIAYGDTKMNLQLSARYNALDQQTRVTIGFPLILTEH